MSVIRVLGLFALSAQLLWMDDAAAQRQVIEPKLLHLRSGVEREWSEFPETSHSQRLDATFASTKNATEQTLFVRQQDVKQAWNVLLNGKKLGALTVDENDMVVTFALPASGLVEGGNSLRIEPVVGGKAVSDDIRVGEIEIASRPVREALREATLDVIVFDAHAKSPLPCRITVLNDRGAMSAQANALVAQRQKEYEVAASLFADGYRSKTLTCVRNTRGIDVPKLARDLRQKHHLVIDPGYGKIKGQTFRLSNLGDETEETVQHLLDCLDDVL